VRVGALNEADSARIADAFDAISRGVVDLIATTAPVPQGTTSRTHTSVDAVIPLARFPLDWRRGSRPCLSDAPTVGRMTSTFDSMPQSTAKVIVTRHSAWTSCARVADQLLDRYHAQVRP
jgi:hypothetical protein